MSDDEQHNHNFEQVRGIPSACPRANLIENWTRIDSIGQRRGLLDVPYAVFRPSQERTRRH